MTNEKLEKANELKEEIAYWEEFKRAICYSRSQNEFNISIHYKFDMEQHGFITANKISNDLGVNEDLASIILDYVENKLAEVQSQFDNL